MSAEDLERFETDMELALYREYRDVLPMFRYVVETDRRFYLCNGYEMERHVAGAGVGFGTTPECAGLSAAWMVGAGCSSPRKYFGLSFDPSLKFADFISGLRALNGHVVALRDHGVHCRHDLLKRLNDAARDDHGDPRQGAVHLAAHALRLFGVVAVGEELRRRAARRRGPPRPDLRPHLGRPGYEEADGILIPLSVK